MPLAICLKVGIFLLFSSSTIARTVFIPREFMLMIIGFTLAANSSASFLFLIESFLPSLPNFLPFALAAFKASIILILILRRSFSANAASI
jgi:hypothetical protein